MAAKKPAVSQPIKRERPKVTVRIPKWVSSSSDKIWRRAMIRVIQDNALNAKVSGNALNEKHDKQTKGPRHEEQ